MSDPARAVTDGLGRLLVAMREQGSRVGVEELLLAHRALSAVDAGSRSDARVALRSVLCSRREDLSRFELAFMVVFGDQHPAGVDSALDELGSMAKAALPQVGVGDRAPGAAPPDPSDQRPVPAAWSDVELLGGKDFSEYTEAEFVLARELILRLARRGPMRRSRRTRAAHDRGELLDLRRMVRSALRCGGEPVFREWRSTTMRPRPLVLVCDVSGSMTPYARMLLQYVHACVAARRRVEAFAFGTRLTRITAELSGRDHDRALARATEAVVDLGGGTRIGAALAELNRSHGRRVGRGAVAVILSDGWDRGDPELLSAEMARLRRSAFHLVWLNPLAAHPDYAPLTRGMLAAIPHTDHLLAGNSLNSLRELADVLEAL